MGAGRQLKLELVGPIFDFFLEHAMDHPADHHIESLRPSSLVVG